jgi:hypothetical protein
VCVEVRGVIEVNLYKCMIFSFFPKRSPIHAAIHVAS